MVTPVSRGSITINSSNPFDPPLIDPGLLSSEFDVFALRTAIKNSQKFLSSPAWKDYILGPVGQLANVMTDTELDEYIRNSASTACHAVGSAGMSGKDAKYGVVDPDLRVKGVLGLRIIDASILPFIICGHTQAPTYVVAERGAELIKARDSHKNEDSDHHLD